MQESSFIRWSTSRFLLTLSVFAAFVPGSALAKIEVSGRGTLMGKAFLSDPPNPSPTLQKNGAFVEIEPTIQIPSDNFRFRGRGIIGYDYTFSETQDREILIPEEFFLEARASKWNILLGYNTYTWGVTDVFNPLDMINPRNYRNPFSPTKIGTPSLSISYGGDSTAFEVVYVPKQAGHKLPPTNSRALPRDASLAEYALSGFSFSNDPVTFYYDRENHWGQALENNYGARLRQSLGKLEAHLVYWEGMPAFPELQTVVSVTSVSNKILSSNIGSQINYERVRMGGGGFIYSFDTVILRFAYAKTYRTGSEYGYTIYQAASLPESGVVAIEKSTSMAGLDWTFLLQYVSQKDNSDKPPSIFSLQQVFDGSLMPGVRLASGVDFSMLLGAIYNPKSQALIATADMTYRLNDSWQGKLTAVSVGGGKLLDSVKSASNIEAGVSFNW